ncbi:hypothetical protein GCM10017788_40450 [Amycolatopsis acidiphila]|nr:hypothetical protein GCM10017788_40450 [Amycolatopsis acidiphila]
MGGLVPGGVAGQSVRVLAEAMPRLSRSAHSACRLSKTRRVPSGVREGLNVESGPNDGICVPLRIIFLTVAESGEGTAHVGAVAVVLAEIGYGAAAGIGAGALAGWVPTRFLAKGWMSPAWQQLSAVVTPLLAYTAAAALGGSGFIAAFVAGSVYGTTGGRRVPRSTTLAEQAGELLNALTFLAFGAVLLSPALAALDWRLACYPIASLTVVRMVPVAPALLGTGARPPTVAFVGWFGPRGLASIVFVLVLVERTGLPERDEILAVVTWTVALSVFAHGTAAARSGPVRGLACRAREGPGALTGISSATGEEAARPREPALAVVRTVDRESGNRR